MPHTPHPMAARRIRAGLLALLMAGATAAMAAGVDASAHDRRTGGGGGCAAQFDAAVRAYVDATDDRSVARYEKLVHDGYTIIFADGDVLAGKAESMRFIKEFFADTGWNQTFKETRRVVSGCRTGFVLFDSVYTEPADNYRTHLVIGLSFTREHGRWVVIQDQNSRLPA